MTFLYLGHVLRLDAPEWYQRQDFRDFLNGRRPGQTGPPATWHRRGDDPDEYSDVFVTYDQGEGSDAPPMIPDDIWAEIVTIADEQGVDEALVWISNVDQPPPTQLH